MVSTRSMRINVDRTQYRDSTVSESPIIRATTFRSKSSVPEEFSTLRCSVKRSSLRNREVRHLSA